MPTGISPRRQLAFEADLPLPLHQRPLFQGLHANLAKVEKESYGASTTQ
jgi:hypothetical protein